MMGYPVDPIGQLALDEYRQLRKTNGRLGKVSANAQFIVSVEKYG